MRLAVVAVVAGIALSINCAMAASEARQFTHGIDLYERAVGEALERAGWKTTGTRCEFRSGRTLVFCMTQGRRGSTRERIQTTMRRISATKIRVRITFLNALNSGIPVLVKNAVQENIRS
jgi:hypothetical protein